MSSTVVQAVNEVTSLVQMPRLLQSLGFVVDERNRRCPCLLHSGNNRTAFSWTEDGRWFCFSCGRGGDRIALVRAVRKCSFRDAIAFLATIGGIQFSVRRVSSADLRRILKQRQRAADVAWQLHDRIVSLRGSFRDRLLRAERLQWIIGERLRVARPPEEQEYYWGVLARLAPVVTFFLASSTFLNNTDTATLIRFVRAPHSARRSMILEGLA